MSHSRALAFSVHPDDDAIDTFANAIQDKMALNRVNGRACPRPECRALGFHVQSLTSMPGSPLPFASLRLTVPVLNGASHGRA